MAALRSRFKSDSIDELFQCKICFENLTNPKTLPCGHVFCLNCLERLEQLQENGFLKSCPLCRTPPSQRMKAQGFPNAYMAMQMMDHLPHLRASDDVTEIMIDTICHLMTKRGEMKEKEKTNLKKSLDEGKREIEKKIEEIHLDLLQRVKKTLQLRKRSLLESVKRRYDDKLNNIRSRIEQVEEPSAVKAWVKANITEELQITENLMEVLPMETQNLDAVFRREHSDAEIFNSMDPDRTLRGLSSDSNKHGHLTRQNDIVHKEQEPEDDPEDGPKVLKSTDTFNTVDFAPPDRSISEKTTCPYAENSMFDVNVQHWIGIDGAADRPESPNIHGVACASRSTLQSVDGKGLQVGIRTSTGRSGDTSVRIHVSEDSTCVASEVGNKTEMRVFGNENISRRRHLLSSTTSETMPTGVVAVISLSKDEGWCMLFKNVLLVFDYHGRAKVEHSFDDTSVLCATSYKRDHFVYVNDMYRIGLISAAGGNITKKDLESDDLFRGGVYFDMAASGDILLIAHAKGERMDGNVTCYTGLDSQKYLQRVRCISPPSGFAKVRCHPVSLCCNQRGTLFTLWRDKDNLRGIIMEYRVEDVESLATIAVDNANDIATITCSPEGFLVTASLK